jgi:hypothetical protein
VNLDSPGWHLERGSSTEHDPSGENCGLATFVRCHWGINEDARLLSAFAARVLVVLTELVLGAGTVLRPLSQTQSDVTKEKFELELDEQELLRE